jgi:hypothetical protein
MKMFSIERLSQQFKFGECCSGATNVKSITAKWDRSALTTITEDFLSHKREERRVDVGWRKNQLERRLHTLPHEESDVLSADIERVWLLILAKDLGTVANSNSNGGWNFLEYYKISYNIFYITTSVPFLLSF